jgi:hypothetical protein
MKVSSAATLTDVLAGVSSSIMASLVSMIGRVYQAFIPPQQPAKAEDALKFGILGAASIAYVKYIYTQILTSLT